MSWEGETDWDEEDVLKGQTILVPVPDLTEENMQASCCEIRATPKPFPPLVDYVIYP